jgi:hypothetical protein
MKLTKKEVEDILQLEINWCLDHPDPTMNRDQHIGFVNGLMQAKILIRNAERVLRSTSFHPDRHDVSIIDGTDE